MYPGVFFQFATCGGLKACATKGSHFPLVNFSTCLVSIDVFFVQDMGNLFDMAACVPTVFLLQNKRLKHTSSNTDLLPLLPHADLLLLLSSQIYNPISLYSFAPFALSVHVCFLLLCLPQCHTLRAVLSTVTLLNKRCVNRCFFSNIFVFYELKVYHYQARQSTFYNSFFIIQVDSISGQTLICF